MLISILNWVAPAATIIAAMMTAANLGARITGWGFVAFVVGSLAWTVMGLSTGQNSLIYANAFLVIVNAIGVWRWLGREAGYEDGAKVAERRSSAKDVPTLFSFNSLAGAEIHDPDGKAAGTIVDVMGRSADHRVAYFVVSEGGVGGVGEKLHAVAAPFLELSGEGPKADFDLTHLKSLPVLKPGAWPAKL